MEFQLSYFKSYRWCFESGALNMPANLENSAVDTGLEKVSFHSNLKSNAKECSTSCTTALISHASKVMLKILPVRLRQYVKWELPDAQVGFRKGRGTRDQIANIRLLNHRQSKRITEKHLLLIYWLSKPLTVWIITNCGNSSRDRNARPPYLLPQKPVCSSRSNS